MGSLFKREKLSDLMTQEERQREDDYAKHKFECMVRYVSRLSRADQVKWAEKQSETLKARVREAIKNAK